MQNASSATLKLHLLQLPDPRLRRHWLCAKRWRKPTGDWRRAAIIRAQHLDWFADRAAWEGLRTVGMVEAMRETGGKQTVERRYYLSSLSLGPETFARSVREHWGVDNQAHWVLDVQMNEDQSRAPAGRAAANLGLLRRLVLNLLRCDTRCQSGIKGKQLNAAWGHAYLQALIEFNA